MTKNVKLAISVFALVASTSCDKIYHCEGKTKMEYKFVLPVTISPAKDTFNIGDTVWIENSFSTQVYNHFNSKPYKLDSFQFKTTMAITDLNSPSPAISYPKPKIITYDGKTSGDYVMSTNYQAIHLEYDREGDMYKYKAAFLVDKPGFYLINFFSTIDGERTDITQCKKKKLYMLTI